MIKKTDGGQGDTFEDYGSSCLKTLRPGFWPDRIFKPANYFLDLSAANSFGVTYTPDTTVCGSLRIFQTIRVECFSSWSANGFGVAYDIAIINSLELAVVFGNADGFFVAYRLPGLIRRLRHDERAKRNECESYFKV